VALLPTLGEHSNHQGMESSCFVEGEFCYVNCKFIHNFGLKKHFHNLNLPCNLATTRATIASTLFMPFWSARFVCANVCEECHNLGSVTLHLK
jgi:hypothetical protein